MLLTPGYPDYNKLSVFGKSLFQTEYKIVKKTFEVSYQKIVLNVFKLIEENVKGDFNVEQIIEEMRKQTKVKSDIKVEYFEEAEDVPDPRDLKQK